MAIKFKRFENNPIIPRSPGTFYSIHVANPDILLFQNRYLLYFRGQAEVGHDQIGLAYSRLDRFDGIHWEIYPNNPIIEVSQSPSAFDSGHILDPATLIFRGQIYLYYSAHHIHWKTGKVPSSIGLALSDDGMNFTKSILNPVLIGTAPEVIFHENRFYLFFQRKNKQGFFEIFCTQSIDGVHFDPSKIRKVFEPSAVKGTFDEFSISTVRIWRENEWFLMCYGGSNRYFDYPMAIGLARSRDLMHWERYPDNPIFERGNPGTWDEGALWFATVLKKDDTYFMWYEGTGTSLNLADETAKSASKQCREEDYGGYRETSFSQIGLATFQGTMADW